MEPFTFTNISNYLSGCGISTTDCTTWCSQQIIDHAYNERWAIIITLIALLVRKVLLFARERISGIFPVEPGLPVIDRKWFNLAVDVCDVIVFWSVVLYLGLVALILRNII